MVNLKDEPKSLGKWAVVYDGQVIGTYDSFDAAAEDAVRIATGASHAVKPKRSATHAKKASLPSGRKPLRHRTRGNAGRSTRPRD
jgi:hypothetical protein